MDIWTIFLKVAFGILVILILYLMTKKPDPLEVWWTWHKNGKRLDFKGDGNTGIIMYFDRDVYFHWHTYHVGDSDSVIKAFKWLNGDINNNEV